MTVLPYDERGEGDAVVLLHAGICDRRMWHEHLDWLADAGHRAIALDLPGFGEAPIRPGPQAPWEDVLGTLVDLGLDSMALVGNSFGAAVALRVAAIAPAAVTGLVLVSPPPLDLDPSPLLTAAWEAEEEALERGDVEGAVTAVLDAWLQPGAPEALRERVGSMQRRAFEVQSAAKDVEDAPDPLEPHGLALERLLMPVLATAGDADMPDFKQGAEEIAAQVSDGEVAIIGGAGHLAPLETPEEFRQLLVAFLAEPGGH